MSKRMMPEMISQALVFVPIALAATDVPQRRLRGALRRFSARIDQDSASRISSLVPAKPSAQ